MPSTITRPRSGRIRPTSDLRNTVLPVPEGPSITLTSPAGRDSEISRHTTWRPKDLVSPSTTTSVPISPPWRTGGNHCCPPSQPVTFRMGFTGNGVPLFGSQPNAPCTVHSPPCVRMVKFRGPEIAALKIGSRFSPTPQFLKCGIVAMPVSGPPNWMLYGGFVALLPVNMTSNGGVSQWEPTSRGTPLTLTLPGAISALSRENAVATLSQVRNLLGWHGVPGRAGPT